MKLIDKNNVELKVGQRVRISPPTQYGSDSSRYRTQTYGEGKIVSLDMFYGAYVNVDGEPDNTRASAFNNIVEQIEVLH